MWYLVLSRTVRSSEEMQPRTQAHIDWLEAQHRAGRALFSGPTSDGAYGIYVLLAPSREAAHELAAQDPYHIHGDRRMEILEWNPRRALRLAGPSIAELEALARGGGQDAPH